MKELFLQDTMTRKRVSFKPIKDNNVTFYHCGPTVYWTQHIGNMRGMTMADLVRRTLEYLGYKVTMARNYTDVGHLTSDGDEGEDKMIKGAKRESLTPIQIATKYIELFDKHTSLLNIESPEFRPRATEFVPQMIAAVKLLLDKGFAYVTLKAIYFDTSKSEGYGELRGQGLSDMESGAGKGLVSDSEKRNAQDFSLWFFKTGVHKNAIQFWQSPFNSPEVENGEGFPGWHLECSIMSSTLLGETLDIHMGGIEHIPVHHTNEIAQSEALTGKTFVNYWLHNEHLLVNGGKMSKSEGTSYSLEDIMNKGFDPMDLRYLFLTAHYRSKQNFTWESLKGAQSARKKLVEFIKNTKTYKMEINSKWKDRFDEKISDDFGIPSGLAVVWEMLKSDIKDEEKLGTLLDFDKVLGLKLADSLNEKVDQSVDVAEIESLIEKRTQAKQNKEYYVADGIRKSLLDKGIILEDTPSGTIWKRV